MALLVGLLILIALAVFAVGNWSPAVPLVVLGAQTTALPLALWVIGAMLAGALTVLAIAALLQLIDQSPSGPRRPRGDRYADEDDARQRYVVDEPPPSGGPRSRGRRTNPYVEEVSAVDPQDGYGDDYSDDYENGEQDAGYRPFSARATASPTQRSNDWDSFSQPRKEWGDWEADASQRSRKTQTYRDERYRDEAYRDEAYRDRGYHDPRRDRVDQVLDVSPIGPVEGVRSPEESGREDDSEAEDWNSWTDYEEPSPNQADRYNVDSAPYSPPIREPRRTYRADSEPEYEVPEYESPGYESPGYESPEYEAPRYEAPRYEAGVDPDYGADAAYEAPYDPPYAPPRESVRSRYAGDDEGYPNDGYVDEPVGESASGPDSEDYIIDYGDEAEIDQFDLKAARRGNSGDSNVAQGKSRPSDENGAGDDDWDDWDVEATPVDEPAPDAAAPRDIYEVPSEPKAVSRSGTIYAYRYRSDGPEEAAEAVNDDIASKSPAADPSPGTFETDFDNSSDRGSDDDPDADSPNRIFTPPYRDP